MPSAVCRHARLTSETVTPRDGKHTPGAPKWLQPTVGRGCPGLGVGKERGQSWGLPGWRARAWEFGEGPCGSWGPQAERRPREAQSRRAFGGVRGAPWSAGAGRTSTCVRMRRPTGEEPPERAGGHNPCARTGWERGRAPTPDGRGTGGELRGVLGQERGALSPRLRLHDALAPPARAGDRVSPGPACFQGTVPENKAPPCRDRSTSSTGRGEMLAV